MKFLFASDSFKGTLSSPKTAELLTQAARSLKGIPPIRPRRIFMFV